MGLLSRGMAWLGDTFASQEAITVQYQRGNLRYSLTAFISSQSRTQADLGESATAVSTRDRVYSIRISDWVAAGIIGEPQHGDRIEEWSGSKRLGVFEVMPTAALPAWDFGEPEQVTYLVRAVRVQSASPGS